MKLFSNFNTKLDEELYQSSVLTYGAERVIIIRRDVIFLWFKIIIPSIAWIILLILVVIVENQFIIGHYPMSVSRAGAIIIFIAMITWIIRITRKLMDYTMDFCIITPAQVLSYDQCGIFNRASRSLDLTNIKSIDIEKNGLIKSFFDYGTVIFFSEGDSMSPNEDMKMGTIRLDYIQNPRKVIDNIMNVVKHNISDLTPPTDDITTP